MAALGRALDNAAKIPGINIIVWFFSSVWLGLIWIALIGIYVAIGSGVSSIRAHFELTDLEFFDAWPMQILLWLMCITLIVVTVRRVRLTLFKLGVWLVHIGILVLVLGCVLYFGGKYEGMTRIFLHKSADAFYDVTERALYVYKMSDDREQKLGEPIMIRLPRLPIYHHYTQQNGAPLNRMIPAAELAKLDPALGKVPVNIAGYYADTRWTRNRYVPGEPTKDVRNRAVGFTMQITGDRSRGGHVQWLVANKPAAKIADFQKFMFEYFYQPDPKRLAALKAEFNSEAALYVHFPKTNQSKIIPLTDMKPIAIEGTAYKIQVLRRDEPRALMTPGYEGAESDGLWVRVTRDDGDGKITTFDRDIISQFPEVSNDFTIENGMPKRVRGGLFDPNIELTFIDATYDHTYIVEEKPGEIYLLHRKVGGALENIPVTIGKEIILDIGGGEVEKGVKAALTIAGETNNAILQNLAFEVPYERMERKTNVGDWIVGGALALEIGEGPAAKTYHVPFIPFADTSTKVGQKPEPVEIPRADGSGFDTYGFLLATTRRPLPGVVTLDKFDFHTQGNTSVPADYVSHITITDKDGVSVKLDAQLNDPAMYKGIAFSQAQWDGVPNAKDEDRHTVLLVGNRPGVRVMMAGCFLMLAGVLYAFYVKPYLLEEKKRSLQKWVTEGRK
jgi:hypothetical protein